mmetsp:Transcript_112528/g.318759  ORF Transcript_112528/g.318759 Transcript_112528/m.318759 type:complete len:284 (-) Transcript_112528:1391-2242(-)
MHPTLPRWNFFAVLSAVSSDFRFFRRKSDLRRWASPASVPLSLPLPSVARACCRGAISEFRAPAAFRLSSIEFRWLGVLLGVPEEPDCGGLCIDARMFATCSAFWLRYASASLFACCSSSSIRLTEFFPSDLRGFVEPREMTGMVVATVDRLPCLVGWCLLSDLPGLPPQSLEELRRGPAAASAAGRASVPWPRTLHGSEPQPAAGLTTSADLSGAFRPPAALMCCVFRSLLRKRAVVMVTSIFSSSATIDASRCSRSTRTSFEPSCLSAHSTRKMCVTGLLP